MNTPRDPFDPADDALDGLLAQLGNPAGSAPRADAAHILGLAAPAVALVPASAPVAAGITKWWLGGAVAAALAAGFAGGVVVTRATSERGGDDVVAAADGGREDGDRGAAPGASGEAERVDGDGRVYPRAAAARAPAAADGGGSPRAGASGTRVAGTGGGARGAPSARRAPRGVEDQAGGTGAARGTDATTSSAVASGTTVASGTGIAIAIGPDSRVSTAAAVGIAPASGRSDGIVADAGVADADVADAHALPVDAAGALSAPADAPAADALAAAALAADALAADALAADALDTDALADALDTDALVPAERDALRPHDLDEVATIDRPDRSPWSLAVDGGGAWASAPARRMPTSGGERVAVSGAIGRVVARVSTRRDGPVHVAAEAGFSLLASLTPNVGPVFFTPGGAVELGLHATPTITPSLGWSAAARVAIPGAPIPDGGGELALVTGPTLGLDVGRRDRAHLRVRLEVDGVPARLATEGLQPTVALTGGVEIPLGTW